MSSSFRATASGLRAAAYRGIRRSGLDGLLRPLALLSMGLLALTACGTRMLKMPIPEAVPSPAGETVEVGSVADERAKSVLGKLDTFTIDSGPDLLTYVKDELANSLSRLGFAVRQVERNAPAAGHKRVLASLLSTELSSQSTLRFPVAAAVRLRIELIDESAQSTFRKEIRGATSRDLGLHTQGGPDDAQLLAEVVDQALSRLVADESFVVAVSISPEEAAERRSAKEDSRKAATKAERATRGPEGGQSPEGVADRLGALDHLLEEGLIDQEDYDQKRRGILDDL